MTGRYLAWPLLASLLLQALVLGGVPRGSLVVCLGGEHHDRAAPAPAAAEAACAVGCGHHSELPVPSIQTAHDRDCSCVDIEITALDLRCCTGGPGDRLPSPQPVAAAIARIGLIRAPAVPPPPVRRDAQPPPDRDLAALRAVRLLV